MCMVPHCRMCFGGLAMQDSTLLHGRPHLLIIIIFFIINTKADYLLGDLTTLSKTMCLLDIFSEIPD